MITYKKFKIRQNHSDRSAAARATSGGRTGPAKGHRTLFGAMEMLCILTVVTGDNCAQFLKLRWVKKRVREKGHKEEVTPKGQMRRQN